MTAVVERSGCDDDGSGCGCCRPGFVVLLMEDVCVCAGVCAGVGLKVEVCRGVEAKKRGTSGWHGEGVRLATRTKWGDRVCIRKSVYEMGKGTESTLAKATSARLENPQLSTNCNPSV